jgi:hypothetical protein
VKNLRGSFRRSEDKSDQSRATMHRRLDEMVERVEKVERSVAGVQDDVTEIKPVTEDVRRWKLMGVGAPWGDRHWRHGHGRYVRRCDPKGTGYRNRQINADAIRPRLRIN